MTDAQGQQTPAPDGALPNLVTGSTRNEAVINGLLLALVLILAGFVRFHALDASSLWNDEGISWALAGRGMGQIARAAAADIHPPGYYWLLKLWTASAGASAWSMRSLSVVLGILLVFVVYALGGYLEPNARRLRLTALLAALLAALNPFQVYYSQEARMYVLLALEGAGLFWALFAYVQREALGRSLILPALWFVICGVAGLWTHYSFPILLAAAGLAYLWNSWQTHRQAVSQYEIPESSSPVAKQLELDLRPSLLRFALLYFLIFLAYLPWLATAIDRVLHWPKGHVYAGPIDGAQMTLHTLVLGPIRSAPGISWPWLLVAAVLPLLGLWALRSRFTALALGLWLLAPVTLMFSVGLFTEAFLKFLLVASPAWCLLAAAAPLCCRPHLLGQAVLAGASVLLAIWVLPGYYADPNARDNYAGVARYIRAIGDADTDLVLLNAPGQQDVWSYYDPGLPVLPLPDQRPPDRAETEAQLASAVQDQRQVYALLWATDESDPDGIVERWLDQHAFKGTEGWQGNLRFAVFSVPSQLSCRLLDPPSEFGEHIVLEKICEPNPSQQVFPGEAALVGLQWRTPVPLSTRYKVSVQLLDPRGQVIAQHDGEPAGGTQPTDTWQPGESIADNHGLPIPLGTPPGSYRLIAALYDPDTGRRLPSGDADHLALGTVQVVRPNSAAPAEILPTPYRVHARLGPIQLVGYAGHRKEFAYAPETPLHPGELAHFTFYWATPDPLPAGWPADLSFSLHLGDQELTAPLAGGDYPTSQWQPGELVRGEFDIPFDGTSTAPVLQVGADHYRLEELPTE